MSMSPRIHSLSKRTVFYCSQWTRYSLDFFFGGLKNSIHLIWSERNTSSSKSHDTLLSETHQQRAAWCQTKAQQQTITIFRSVMFEPCTAAPKCKWIPLTRGVMFLCFVLISKPLKQADNQPTTVYVVCLGWMWAWHLFGAARQAVVSSVRTNHRHLALLTLTLQRKSLMSLGIPKNHTGQDVINNQARCRHRSSPGPSSDAETHPPGELVSSCCSSLLEISKVSRVLDPKFPSLRSDWIQQLSSTGAFL